MPGASSPPLPPALKSNGTAHASAESQRVRIQAPQAQGHLSLPSAGPFPTPGGWAGFLGERPGQSQWALEGVPGLAHALLSPS